MKDLDGLSLPDYGDAETVALKGLAEWMPGFRLKHDRSGRDWTMEGQDMVVGQIQVSA